MDQHDGHPWETGGDLPWATPEAEVEGDADGWQSDLHGDWPENLAGPEYWLYKRQRDE